MIAELQRTFEVARGGVRGDRSALLTEAVEHNKWFGRLDDEAKQHHRHDLMKKLHERRSAGKKDDDYLFHEYPAPRANQAGVVYLSLW